MKDSSRQIRLVYVSALLISLTFMLAACDGQQETGKTGRSGKLHVVCTTGMIGDLVKNIGGDRLDVTSLMGPGVDPHVYKASHGDVEQLSAADIVFYNGLLLEGKMVDIFKKMGRQKPVIPVARDIPEDSLIQPPEYEGNYDPHVWFDIELWQQTIPVVVSELSSLDSAGTDTYRSNAEEYNSRLDSLDRWVKQEISRIPEQQRVLVTAHDAFGYFGKAYDIEVVGLQGISTVAEFGVKDVRNLADLIVERQVKAIFVESSIPERPINAVKQACQSRGFSVRIGGTLYSDAMGPVGSGADTYLTMVQHNVNTIVSALN